MEPQTTLETTVPDRPAVVDVLHEHLEEVAHLSVQWRKLLFSSEVPLRRLRRHANRIEAHLDGLRIGGAATEHIASAMLTGDDPWLVYAAARVWLEQARPEAKTLQAKLIAVPPELRCAWKEALRRLSVETVERVLAPKGAGDQPIAILEVAADAWGWHGLLTAEAVENLARSPEPRVRFVLARHVAQPGMLARLLDDPDSPVRRAAMWGLALQNPGLALERSRRLSESETPDPFALRVIGLLGERADGARLLPLLKHKQIAPAALLALRDLGCVEFTESVLAHLEGDNAESATVAAEVFESLAGRMPLPNGETPAPPGISAARLHWEQVRKGLNYSTRRLWGQPLPWPGDAADEPMAWVWRRVLATGASELAWLRREVPDGFFSGVELFEALPGE